ncbi:flagellar basal-body rod protein FlgC [Thermincola ferriacetica]|uniref:Flagellar basal-body rod protein FlgC n=2 Tax=Thermincola TaxID=278993 RepID=D5XFH6_THEPJ|nr:MULTISPECIES: flagellar basal body rod protein FlgC [Thermincola]ADG82397.1 flagellar basal-body rod protein FlgC [Thermincola potens JR]KNZ70890.1 flagellar basal-body rod protein FlgC [Thermincola ferriacetica]
MGMFDSFDISASGLTAQRLRMDLISENIANVNTTRTASGGPYRRKLAVFEAKNGDFDKVFQERLDSVSPGKGVRVTKIIEDQSPLKLVYNPNHPDANAQGYVEMPNVNIVTEMVDMISATRAYEANVASIRATKEMFAKAMEIGR